MQDAKNRHSRHLRTIIQLCRTISSQLRHVSTIQKNLLRSNTSSTCPGELRPTSSWDRSGSLGHPSKFQRVSRLRSVTARQSSIGHQPNFAALNRGRRHLYLAGQPSRWALAHISSYYYYRCMWFKSCFVLLRSCVKTTAVIKDGLHFLLLAYSGCPWKEAVKQMSGFDVEFKLISVLKLNQCELTTD